ncbi:cell division protein FtsQ/DivIB [Pseudalkalibacillus caeni]|uniref:Cell division protein DivIB n=1 Tax=Exobacillus caeni TaxID=2574798 RepID=A0A5R9F611_9BACL|nr:FtsQ-type POTRA domain-containing protein [Pseudalkalibacillus caeni]TLS35245.1 FtsQ-type POTRA domain-containing protein [Pseudalkalibacillus caeni]
MNDRKVVTIEDRIPKLKEQRKQRTNRRLIFYLSIFFVLILLVIYFQSSLSNVKTITVEGNNFVSDKQIIKWSSISSEDSYWNVNESQAADRIEESKKIASAAVNKKWPNRVAIKVEEFDRVAYLKKGTKFFPIIQNGDILDALSSSEVPVNAPLLVDWDESVQLQEMAAELRKVPQGIINRISEIHFTPDKDHPLKLTLYMTDGYEVDSSIRNFSKKISVYPAIVEKLDKNKKGVIHLNESSYFTEYGTRGEEQKEDEEG